MAEGSTISNSAVVAADYSTGGGDDPKKVRLDPGDVRLEVTVVAVGTPHNALQSLIYTMKHLSTCDLVVKDWGGGR